MRSMVKNAADQGQVRAAEKKEAYTRDHELNDLRRVLETPEGRRVLWRFMSKCNVFGSVWEPSARIHYNSGRQDFGHFVMAEIVDASEEYLFLMMKENKERILSNV